MEWDSAAIIGLSMSTVLVLARVVEKLSSRRNGKADARANDSKAVDMSGLLTETQNLTSEIRTQTSVLREVRDNTHDMRHEQSVDHGEFRKTLQRIESSRTNS